MIPGTQDVAELDFGKAKTETGTIYIALAKNRYFFRINFGGGNAEKHGSKWLDGTKTATATGHLQTRHV